MCSGRRNARPLGTLPGVDLTASPPVFDETETPGAVETEITTTTAETPETTATADLTGTAPATDTTATAETGTAITGTPGIPVTGDVIVLECQFCIEGMGHTLLVFPETSTFEMVGSDAALSTPGPDTGCTMVDSFGGRQVVLCRGEENTSLALDICANGTDCTQVVVELQSCPDILTPGPGVTDTPTPAAGATDTPTSAATATPTP